MALPICFSPLVAPLCSILLLILNCNYSAFEIGAKKTSRSILRRRCLLVLQALSSAVVLWSQEAIRSELCSLRRCQQCSSQMEAPEHVKVLEQLDEFHGGGQGCSWCSILGTSLCSQRWELNKLFCRFGHSTASYLTDYNTDWRCLITMTS